MREGDDRDLPDRQVVEQACIGMRLVVERGTPVKGRAQIAKARGCDPVELLAQPRLHEKFALVEAATASVDHQDGGT